MRPDDNRPLTAAQQYAKLRSNPACAGTGSLQAGQLVWRYEALPSPLGRTYMVRIVYQQGASPKVYVDSPDLALLAGGRKIPHVYEQKPTRLCLYLPKQREWQSGMRLDETIVPWVAVWLYFFEEWLASDVWKGGGVHPNDATQERSQERRYFRQGRRRLVRRWPRQEREER